MPPPQHDPSPSLLDRRIAHRLVKPLVATPLHPNHLTTLTLLLGLASAACFMSGTPGDAKLGALCYMLAIFSDHLDGELARLANKTSAFGYLYDFIVGGFNYTVLFASIGIGLEATFGPWTAVLGIGAACCNPAIMYMRLRMDKTFGLAATEHPSYGPFDLEDFMYLIGPVTWSFGIVYFFVPFALGTLAYLAWTVLQYQQWFSRPRQS